MENGPDIESQEVEKSPVLEAIEKARKAQQKYYMTHDVQLEIDLNEEDTSQKKQAL